MSLRDNYKKPSPTQNNVFKKPFPIELGRNSFRLVPPTAEMYPDGKWFAYYSYHFGYQVLDREGKPVSRTFACPRTVDPKTKEILVECPECLKIEEKQYELNELVETLTESKASEDEVAERTLELRAWLEAHNRTTKVYVHVMNKANEFGYMQLPVGAFRNRKNPNNLTQVIKNLDEVGVDVFHPDTGVWLYIEKTGKGRYSTTYNVGVEQDNVMVGGKRQQTDKQAPLTDEQMAQAVKDCPAFSSLMNIIPVKVIEQLVKSDGTPETVNSIMGFPVQKSAVEEVKAVVSGNKVPRVVEPQAEDDEDELPELPMPKLSRREKFLRDYGENS